MGKKLIGGILTLILLTAVGCDSNDPRRRTKAGAGIGAATGMAMGAALDNDDPERGALLGGVVGAAVGSLIGYAWDRYDEQRLNRTLETVPSGQSVKWVNPDTNMEWSATPAPARQEGGDIVRDVQLEGRDQQGNRRTRTIKAHRRANGQWSI